MTFTLKSLALTIVRLYLICVTLSSAPWTQAQSHVEQLLRDSSYDALRRSAGDSYARRRFLHHMGNAAVKAMARSRLPVTASTPQAYGYTYNPSCPCTAHESYGCYLPMSGGMPGDGRAGSANLVRELHTIETGISPTSSDTYEARDFSVRPYTFGSYRVDTAKGSCVMVPRSGSWKMVSTEAVPAPSASRNLR